MVLIEGLKRAGKDPTRERFTSTIESIHEMNAGLGAEVASQPQPVRPQGIRQRISDGGEEWTGRAADELVGRWQIGFDGPAFTTMGAPLLAVFARGGDFCECAAAHSSTYSNPLPDKKLFAHTTVFSAIPRLFRTAYMHLRTVFPYRKN